MLQPSKLTPIKKKGNNHKDIAPIAADNVFKLIGDKYLLSARTPNKSLDGMLKIPIMLRIQLKLSRLISLARIGM